MRTLLLLVLAFLPIGCASVPTPFPNKDGSVARAWLLGGKGMLNYNADGSMAFNYHQVQSFQHAMQTTAAVATGLMSMKVSLAKEVTERFLQGQITKRQAAQLQTQIQLAQGAEQLVKVQEFLKAGAEPTIGTLQP